MRKPVRLNATLNYTSRSHKSAPMKLKTAEAGETYRIASKGLRCLCTYRGGMVEKEEATHGSNT